MILGFFIFSPLFSASLLFAQALTCITVCFPCKFNSKLLASFSYDFFGFVALSHDRKLLGSIAHDQLLKLHQFPNSMKFMGIVSFAF
ncbi:hypothetical protein Fmac_020678 [Flemingia macrophylla]|uniref:Secreted protein n=1 Tax=Flemingia macrophylla TaxID=520843 RepID=A0ABD1LUN9_9FABA